jgi:hypothetical protein
MLLYAFTPPTAPETITLFAIFAAVCYRARPSPFAIYFFHFMPLCYVLRMRSPTICGAAFMRDFIMLMTAQVDAMTLLRAERRERVLRLPEQSRPVKIDRGVDERTQQLVLPVHASRAARRLYVAFMPPLPQR